jgi:gas vesicle protein GvpL/GvpF
LIEICAITAEPPPPLTESDNLHAVRSAGLVALCAPAEDQALTPAVLWSREEMLEKLMEQCDLLPVRYGSRVEDDAAVARVLSERQGQLAEALERVRGAVEVAVRVLQTDEPSGTSERPPESGADYLRSKARHAKVATDVHEALGGLARASTEQPGRAGSEVLRAAYLVDRGSVGSFVERVAELQTAKPQLRLLCTGPWPPYSFTSG